MAQSVAEVTLIPFMIQIKHRDTSSWMDLEKVIEKLIDTYSF